MTAFITSLLLLTLSTIILAVILIALGFSFRSYRWLKTEGIILRIGTSKESGGLRLNFANVFTARIKYVYAVAGKKYRNNAISAISISDTAGFSAKRAIKKYPEGKIIDVYYCPDDPRVSCLERGVKDPVIIAMITAALFFAFVLFADGYNMLKTCF